MKKRIIITGATKGLGRAIAELFAADGFELAVNARTAGDLEQMKREFKEKYDADILIFQTDMRKKEEVQAFAEYVLSQWDGFDILVNNAGLFLPGSIMHEQDGVLEKQMETNVYSVYHLTRALLPSMLEKGSGHIFNMCSIASITAFKSGLAYTMSKFALLGFTKVLRQELKNKGIRVTALLPGATWSDSWAGAELPKSRLMQASDIAIAVKGAFEMSSAAVVEEIVLRPQLGDLPDPD